MAKRKSSENPKPTSVQGLATIIKTARDVMRKDKGLSGELDRLPVLTWVMFLKFLDDLEIVKETAAEVAGKRYRSAIEKPYRWRDWASKEDGITGEDLIRFVNQDEAVLPNGKRGPGLFAYLRNLQSSNGDRRRDVLATVFRGIQNRMINGYLLREVINKVGGIHFANSGEIHTLGHLYESMLKEMRDAAGDSGEFYTPRPLVRFMMQALNPQLGETILDPACGTGGFLAEAFTHLEKKCRTVEDRRNLQESAIRGGEAKPLPYLLAQMNLLLHGLESPQIDSGNSLRFPLKDITDRDRVDVVLTNPPFGGEEEPGIQSNFPHDKQTAETALLFLQLIMRKLRREPRPGRAAVVVPNGVLFSEGVGERIKQELLSEFNLHTVVRLPPGVFAPYTPIPTNILFFERAAAGTTEVWYYQLPLPNGRRAFTKTTPLQAEDLAPAAAWWRDRRPTPHAWLVSADHIRKNRYNLDLVNPREADQSEARSPQNLLHDAATAHREALDLLLELEKEVGR